METAVKLAILTFAALLLTAAAALAVPTQVTVMVRAKDAKFVGGSMMGARIIIRNADTGEILAKGVTEGTSGDTEKMMKKPLPRGAPLSDAASARFNATIDIDDPTPLEIRAYGPLARRQSANAASVTLWLVPGKNLTGGDGVLLEIPGFVVTIQAPPAHLLLSKKELPRKVELRASVTMMCGCQITPGGTWDANRLEVSALIRKKGKTTGEFPLSYAGEPSRFVGSMEVKDAGVYEVTVYAYDPANGNTGVDTTTVVAE